MMRQYSRLFPSCIAKELPLFSLEKENVKGMTLLEVMITVGIFSILLVGTFGILNTTQPVVISTSVEINLQERARSIAEQMVKELRNARRNTDANPSIMIPAEPHPTLEDTYNSLTFERVLELSTQIDGEGGPIRVEDPITYRLIDDPTDPQNGLDDNSNGVADEKTLIREQGTDRLIITRKIEYNGVGKGELWFENETAAKSGLIKIRFTMFTSDPSRKRVNDVTGVLEPIVYRVTIETDAYARTIE